jgi:hypothetical protein
MSRERLHEGWTRAWQRFYSPSAMLRRWTVQRNSSWIQTLGYWPLNFMQHQLARHKILGGNARFRSQDRPLGSDELQFDEQALGSLTRPLRIPTAATTRPLPML